MDHAFPVFKSSADMIKMAMGENQGDRKVSQFPDKCFQASGTFQSVDQYRSVFTFDEIGEFSALTENLLNMIIDCIRNKKLILHDCWLLMFSEYTALLKSTIKKSSFPSIRERTFQRSL